MKQFLKKTLAQVLHPLNTRLGYVRSGTENAHEKDQLLKSFYTTIKQVGFTPAHIVDIGANHGTWTRETLKYFPEAYYTLLEPQAEMEKSISDILARNSKVKFNAVGAGEKSGTFRFTIADRDDSCSFMYTEEEAKKMGLRQVEVPVVTVNELIKASGRPVPDIIKIDAEGLDLPVLRGASDYFGKTEIFMVEAGIMNRFVENSCLEVINFMDTNGYKLFDITDMNRPFKVPVLWLVELVFVKKNGYLDKHSYNN